MNDEVYCPSGSRKDLFLLFWVLPVGYISMTKSARNGHGGAAGTGNKKGGSGGRVGR